MSHLKLKQVRIEDFSDYSAVPDEGLTADSCIWCLGVSQTAVGKDEYVRITVDYALAAGRRCWAATRRFVSAS